MRIDVKGRNFPVDKDLRERVEKKFAKVGRQVSDLARLEIELYEEANPSIRESEVAEVILYIKGATFRAKDASTSMVHSINVVAEEIARQVKRHRDKQRGPRVSLRTAPYEAPAAP
jgi:putative sigma-54 modulation protein